MLTGYYLAKKRLQNTQARDRKFLVGAAVNSDARANIFACMHSTYYNLSVRDMGRTAKKSHDIYVRKKKTRS